MERISEVFLFGDIQCGLCGKEKEGVVASVDSPALQVKQRPLCISCLCSFLRLASSVEEDKSERTAVKPAASHRPGKTVTSAP